MLKLSFILSLIVLASPLVSSAAAEMFQNRLKGENIVCGSLNFDRTENNEALNSKVANPFGEGLTIRFKPHPTSRENLQVETYLTKVRNSAHARQKFRKSQALYKNQQNLFIIGQNMAAIPNGPVTDPVSHLTRMTFALVNITPDNEASLFNDEYANEFKKVSRHSAAYFLQLKWGAKPYEAEGLLRSTKAAAIKHPLSIKFRCSVRGV